MHTNDCEEAHDVVLLQRLAAGDAAAFSRLYDKYWEQVYADAYKRLKCCDRSKDVVQEIFASLWHRRETLQIGNLPAYLKTAVRNRVFKVLAKEKLTHPFFDFLHEAPDGPLQSDANLLWQESLRSYENFLNALPPRRQQIFRLRFYDDLSTGEIAHQLQLSRKTVQNQLGRVVEHLKMHLFFTVKLLILTAVFFGE